MKKRITLISTILLIAVLCVCFASCQRNVDKPEGTNLEYWLGDYNSQADLEKAGCTYVTRGFGNVTLLGSSYTLEYNENGKIKGSFVLYQLSGYPDHTDKYAITRIYINDPEVNIYGLTINSTEEEFEKILKKNGFSKKTQQVNKINFETNEIDGTFTSTHYRKNKVRIELHESDYGEGKEIFIMVGTTNKTGAIY